jgi:hypothetical protein
MLIEVSAKEFKHRFGSDPHPYISEPFTEFNKWKVDRIVRLIEDNKKVSMGLLAGIKDGILRSPFSAPFGGFHYRNESVYINNVQEFIKQLLDFSKNHGIKKINLTLPPSIYQQSINAKLVNTLIRSDFDMELPEITNWIELRHFNEVFSHRNSREYYKQSLKNKLLFCTIKESTEKELAFEIIRENRQRFGRPIYMSFDDILQMEEIWPVDFFGVKDTVGEMVASGIFYRFPRQIAYAVFWADTEKGRPLRAMDFLVFNLLRHYRSAGFEYIDLGISTELGIPNDGLLRFKETHEAVSSLRYSFTWEA